MNIPMKFFISIFLALIFSSCTTKCNLDYASFTDQEASNGVLLHVSAMEVKDERDPLRAYLAPTQPRNIEWFTNQLEVKLYKAGFNLTSSREEGDYTVESVLILREIPIVMEFTLKKDDCTLFQKQYTTRENVILIGDYFKSPQASINTAMFNTMEDLSNKFVKDLESYLFVKVLLPRNDLPIR